MIIRIECCIVSVDVHEANNLNTSITLNIGKNRLSRLHHNKIHVQLYIFKQKKKQLKMKKTTSIDVPM